METALINVPFTGTGDVPLISIGGAHKGVTYMRLDWVTGEEFYVNYNLDCIGPLCHDKYHSVYGLKDINPVDFMNFIKRFGVR